MSAAATSLIVCVPTRFKLANCPGTVLCTRMASAGVPIMVNWLRMVCVLPAASWKGFPALLTRLSVANVVLPLMMLGVVVATQLGASTKFTAPEPALKLPRFAQLPDKVMLPLPATIAPPEAMLTCLTLLRLPPCRFSVPATMTSLQPKSTLPPPTRDCQPPAR